MKFAGIACLLAIALGCQRPQTPQSRKTELQGQRKEPARTETSQKPSGQAGTKEPKPTHVVVHNVILHTGTPVKLKVKWLRGTMIATGTDRPASFDDTKSFRFEIDEGLVGVGLNDLSAFLRSGVLKDSPLQNAKVTPQNGQLKITGTLKKLVPIPVQLIASLGVSPNQKYVRMHVEKLSALKIPVKGLLGVFKVKVDDLFDPKGKKGIDVNGDNIDIDVNELLPPPRAEGKLTQVKVWRNGDLMEYYGQPREDAIKTKQWRNFMRLRGGIVNFGKLTMHNADLLMVDTSQSDWLNFDVNHYQEQMVNGTTRITPQAGLQIFIPDINKLPKTSKNHSVSLQWMKNRDVDPPPDVQ